MKRLTELTIVLGLICGVHSAAHAEDWALFRGNAQLHGRAGALPSDLEPLWVFEVAEGIEAGAAIADGVVFVGALDGTLHAVSLADGKP